MPNIKSAKKELRKGQKLSAYNKKIKDNVKSLVKKSRKAIDAGDKKSDDMVQKAFKAIDKAAQKGVIKNNTRDRKKARLHKKLNQSSKK
jgi:small subunit ribosomal protein S20